MIPVLCTATITDFGITIFKNQIYTAIDEVERNNIVGKQGYRLAEFTPQLIFAKVLFIELPDTSDIILDEKYEGINI